MPCCPVLLSLYCIVIVSLNEINGYGDVSLFQILRQLIKGFRFCEGSNFAISHSRVTYLYKCVGAAHLADHCRLSDAYRTV